MGSSSNESNSLIVCNMKYLALLAIALFAIVAAEPEAEADAEAAAAYYGYYGRGYGYVTDTTSDTEDTMVDTTDTPTGVTDTVTTWARGPPMPMPLFFTPDITDMLVILMPMVIPMAWDTMPA